MYFRGNSASVEGEHAKLAVGVRLAPASTAAWTFRTPFRRLILIIRYQHEKLGKAPVFASRFDDGAAEFSEGPIEISSSKIDASLFCIAWKAELPAAAPERVHAFNLQLNAASAPVEIRDLIIRPFGIGDDPVGDELLLEEGRYWDAWIGAHRDAGDRSISDGEIPATHPSFLPIGIREPDDRDRNRRYGFFPDAYSDFLLAPAAEKSGGLGIDLGTGCGQFALQCARQGMRMIGADLGAGLLAIARATAQENPELDLHYVRAESAMLPFAGAAFDLVAAKESLHHVADPQAAFAEIKRTMKNDAVFIASEHIYASPGVARLFERVAEWLRPPIQRRYPAGPVSAVLTYPSPLEDSGCNAVLAAFEGSFARRRKLRRWILVDFVEMHAHYAFRRWRPLLAPPLLAAAWLVEAAVCLAAGRPLGSALEGREKR